MGILSTIFDWIFPGTEAAAIDYLETVAEEPHHEQAEFYHPSPVKRKTIGIKSASLQHRSCDSNYLNKNDLTHTIFDTTTRIDAARILLTNSTGAARYLTGCAIRGLAVKSFSGGAGWIHDSFVDYESIARSGERKFKVANDFIVTKDQVEELADFHWKDKRGKHVYSISIPGCWLWIEQGEWYTLQGGGAGEDEYIDSKVRCESVDIEQSAGSLGTTTVVFKEVEEAWSKTSTAVAHFTSSGNLLQHPNSQEIVVASSTYIGVADYYCDGTADEVEINKAINWLAGTYGGGWVRLTEGQFNIAAAISSKANIVIQGRGWNTIIEKNGDYRAIEAIGSSGNELDGVIIDNLKITRNASDTYSKPLIYFSYIKNSIISFVDIYDAYNYGIDLRNSFDCFIINSRIEEGSNYAIMIPDGNIRINIQNCYVNNQNYGIWFSGSEGQLINCQLHNIGFHPIYVDNNTNTISSNRIIDCWTGRYINMMGAIYISGLNAVNTHINNNFCKDNGNLIQYAACEWTDEPMIFDETTPYKLPVGDEPTWARDAGEQYDSSYSYKFTFNGGGAADEYVFSVDNNTITDMHGLIAGLNYIFSAYGLIKAAGGMALAEMDLIFDEYYTGAWHENKSGNLVAADAWEKLSVNLTLNILTTGIRIGIKVASTATAGELAYFDKFRLQPMGIHNKHNQHFQDNGMRTII